MARVREKRHGGYTGIVRGDRNRAEERTKLSQIEERGSYLSWRLVSLAIVLILSGVLALMFLSDVFYVHSVAVGGLRYMTKEEVFTYSEIANVHVFWVDPETVRQNLLRYPTVADAQVRITWPPNMVNIVVEEREPALVWEQNGAAVWIDIQGNVMAQREDRPDLVRVAVDNPLVTNPIEQADGVALEVVRTILQLQDLLPEVNVFRYDPDKGVGFRNESGWDIWLGVGQDMPEKLSIYNTLQANVITRGIQPGEINIVDPDAPYYTVLWGR
jgi:cell division septal protein FtsQ